MESVKKNFLFCIILFLVSNYLKAQIIQGSVGGGKKNPFGDCDVVNEGHVLKCKPKGTEEPRTVTWKPPNIFDKWFAKHTVTPHRSFNCTHGNFSELEGAGNCTFENVTEHIRTTTPTVITTTSPKHTTTRKPTTTVDMVLVFARMGISTEKPQPTTHAPVWNQTLFNETFNITSQFNFTFFNMTHEFNYTEFVMDEHPFLRPDLITAYAEIEKASHGKPAVTVFDRTPILKCNKLPHPVTKLIYFFEATQIIAEYQDHICDADYSEYCKTVWKDCQADGLKLCPKTCKIAGCAGLRQFGYLDPDRPKFGTNSSCGDNVRYNCQFLKVKSDCLSDAAAMSELCPSTCYFCPKDAPYLPWLPEYRKMISWLMRYKNGKYRKYGLALLYDESLIHEAAKHNMC